MGVGVGVAVPVGVGVTGILHVNKSTKSISQKDDVVVVVIKMEQ